MTEKSPGAITGYHAHVYYDATTKPQAEILRADLEARFQAEYGRWHDAPIGPHPRGSYQAGFRPELLADILPWLALNRRGLTVFIHPMTGDVLADHSDHVIWLGPSETIDLSVL